MPERQNANRLTTENDAVRDSFTATLIHSCCSKKQQPALGQISISRVGQYSISADRAALRYRSAPCPGQYYHYKAKQLGITGAKGGFFSGYEATKLGKWLVSLGAQINRDWQQELLILIAILCLRSQAIAGPR